MSHRLLALGLSEQYAQLLGAKVGQGAVLRVCLQWLFEEFISSSFGTDLRLYSLHGEALACEMRTAREGFRANLS